MERRSMVILVAGLWTLVACDKQKEEDCQKAGAEITSCLTKARMGRNIPTGPSHEMAVSAWRGEVRVCAGMDTIVRVETPAVKAALKQFADYYGASEPECSNTGNCQLKGPADKYEAAEDAMGKACN